MTLSRLTVLEYILDTLIKLIHINRMPVWQAYQKAVAVLLDVQRDTIVTDVTRCTTVHDTPFVSGNAGQQTL